MTDAASASFGDLPEILREIAAVAGLEAAMKILDEYGGVRLKIPRTVGPQHQLVKCVGLVAAQKICDHFAVNDADGRPIGNFQALIPLAGTGVSGRAKRRLAKLLESGTGVRKAARLTGLHERTAWRTKAKLQHSGDADQADLFKPPQG